MISHLEEPFYRNKRTAIASSALLLAATAFSLRVSEQAILFSVFAVDAAPHTVVVLSVMLVCIYLNVSYFLHYYTEIPEWRRNPDTGLLEVGRVAENVHALLKEVSKERKHLDEAEQTMLQTIELYTNKLSSLPPTNIGMGFDEPLFQRLSGKAGPIYQAAFNELSRAIRDAQARSTVERVPLGWDQIAEGVTVRAAAGVVAAAKAEIGEMLDRLQYEASAIADKVTSSVDELKREQSERGAQITLLNQNLRKTLLQLRNWRTAMNIRLRVQYLWLPVTLFVVAMSYATASLILGRPANQLLSCAYSLLWSRWCYSIAVMGAKGAAEIVYRSDAGEPEMSTT